MQTRPAKSINERMIKVDHAGENGAVNIYRAQRFMSYWRAPQQVEYLRHTQSHEEKHRTIFANYLQHHHIRPCISYHFCGIGGFGLGTVTGCMGPKAVAATTFAVESVVLAHLQAQTEHLKVHDPHAYTAVLSIIVEEQEHHDHALLALKGKNIWTKPLVSLVSFCTESIIRFGMREPKPYKSAN